MSIVTNERIVLVADKLYISAYEARFGGKKRGRFLITRSDLRELLGVSKLTTDTIDKLAEEFLSTDLALIDMEDCFGVMETSMILNWRKIPSRLVEEYKNEIDSELIEDEELEELFSEVGTDILDDAGEGDDDDDNEE